LALEISLASFGSSQIFLLPHRRIDEASRFCTRSELIKKNKFERLIEKLFMNFYLIFFQNDESVMCFFSKSTNFAILNRVVTQNLSKQFHWSDIITFDGLGQTRRIQRNTWILLLLLDFQIILLIFIWILPRFST
jgi:hypothetical protein